MQSRPSLVLGPLSTCSREAPSSEPSSRLANVEYRFITLCKGTSNLIFCNFPWYRFHIRRPVHVTLRTTPCLGYRMEGDSSTASMSRSLVPLYTLHATCRPRSARSAFLDAPVQMVTPRPRRSLCRQDLLCDVAFPYSYDLANKAHVPDSRLVCSIITAYAGL